MTFSTDKEAIQKRLYKEAAEISKKYLDIDISSLDRYDPLVYMILGACASEFKIIADEIESSKSRMLEHLAQLLTPDAYVGPIPAHGVLFAPPAIAGMETDIYRDQFVYASSKGGDVFFSPTGNFPLTNGQVKYMVSGNSFYVLQNVNEKDELFRADYGNRLPAGALLIGLTFDEEKAAQELVNFYFHLSFEEHYQELEEILLTSRWSINGQALDSRLGLWESEEKPMKEYHDFHLIRKHEQEVNAFYKSRFLSLSFPEGNNINRPENTRLPSMLRENFNAEDLDKALAEPVVWFQVEFSGAAFESQEAMDKMVNKLVCQVNCFPVLNRRLHVPQFSLGPDINMFALKSAGFFYGIEDVRSSKQQKEYVEKPFSQLINEEKLKSGQKTSVYALRREGVHRFDKRNALELMENIIQILREESLIYHALGKNVVTHNLKSIRKSINDINNKIYQTKQDEGLEDKCFISFPPVQDEYVVVRFWSTDGRAGRNIPPGERLKSFDASRSHFDEGKIKLLTKTSGGRNKLLQKERLNAYKSSIVVKEKIVTKEDIKIYCYEHIEDEIAAFGIENGFEIGPDNTTGFKRTLDVQIKLEGRAEQHHCQYLSQKLTVELNSKSTSLVPIRVFVG